MANPENLIPNDQRTPSERRANARKAGKASGEARRRRKAFADAFNTLLQREFTDHNGNKMQGVEAIAAKTFKAALDGDLKAMQIIRDTVGEMPMQRIEIDTIDPAARAEMDKLLGLDE